ncbi:uncharacterized protein TRAVEDRAFT_42639 [Trametes versicolor FP-101664 SS1]|uniref:uncharacterized protein n=1 Tax=Trametes versicolor (strain FP-101664) TaxID=717944 RepID=UPI0004623046|nr:uncharacterized protein TRAVEDRAFT_42639 [Trametes versicolor FP-101664 SS1]EIW65261.1 hypothetical protein TRAVEDRAFT_42639 [Trametes versicolor FP-101664 SS1]
MLPGLLDNLSGEEAELSRVQAADATASSSSPSRTAGLLPPFGVTKMSHLPTPQSPSNAAQYAPERNGSFVSPVHNVNREATSSQATHRAATPLREEPQAISAASFMTPESSPLFPRKVMHPVTPQHASDPSSAPHTPHRSHPGSSEAAAEKAGDRVVVDTAVPPLAPAPIITTPVSTHSRGLTPASRLSSPFRGRSADRRATNSRSPMPREDSPMALDVFAGVPASLPPLATPVPQRALGGEIQRIHLQLAADRAELLSEKEARRPDYLVREKRSHPDSDIPTLDELDAASIALGVTESPVKGRRLQLFQATSEETFEQSLLAGGYPGYGQSPAYKVPEPQTPLPNAKSGRAPLSQRALQWLHQATPGQPGPSTLTTVEEAPAEDTEWVPSERETKKRKRLDMFREKTAAKESAPKLYPVEVEGRGRLLLNVPPEGSPTHPETPVKRRVVRRKKRRGGRKGAHGRQDDDEEGEPLEPNWPDAAFPWCMRLQERTDVAKMEQEERLRWIERFLDRSSESDEEEEEDQVLRPPLQSHDNDQIAHRRGRGKMVPLRANPESRTRNEHVLTPSDPADARAALLSKRSVRTLSFRRRSNETSGEDVTCIGCSRGDDGSELVQCDECQTWYHLRCVGFKTIAELGREEDPWYCDRCLDIPPASPLPEPTFVPTDDRPSAPTSRRDSLFLQNPLLLESPAPHWDSDTGAGTPQTPVRGGDGDASNADRTFSTRSSWGDSSRAGPSTPESSAKAVRVYHTPGPFSLERDQLDPETPFDPTTTPSRGIKFSGGPPPTLGLSTPRGGYGVWAGRGGHTPTPGAKLGGSQAWRHGVDGSGGGPFSSPHVRSIYSVAYDDTPVTRAPRVPERGTTVQGRRLWGSPGPGFARPMTPSPPLKGGGCDGD